MSGIVSKGCRLSARQWKVLLPSTPLHLACRRALSQTSKAVDGPISAGHSTTSSIPYRSAKRNLSTRTQDSDIPVSDLMQSLLGDFQPEEEPHMLPWEVAGGYDPLTLGKILEQKKYGKATAGGTFEIARKLGWGMCSSVWLARSSGCAKIKTKYQAVKSLTVAATASTFDGKFPEWNNLILLKKDPTHPGYSHCSHSLGTMQGSTRFGAHHYPHIYFVFEPMGSDLHLLRKQQPVGGFSVFATKRIIKRALLALDYIHTVCGLVHTDLKPSNMLVSLGKDSDSDVDNYITAYLETNPSESYPPRTDPHLSSEPIVTAKTQPLPNFGLNPDLSNIRIKVADFGSARKIEDCKIGLEVQPLGLRAPEIILGHAWSTPVDIWSLGCLVFEFLVKASLFSGPYKPGTTEYTISHLISIKSNLGPFPKHFLAACTRRDQYFDEKGSLRRAQEVSITIESCLDNYKRLKTEEIGPAADFIRRCLLIDPAARPTAKELLEDEWLKDV